MKRNYLNMGLAVIGMTILALTAATTTRAQTAAYSFTSAPVANSGPLSLGFEFTTNSAVSLSSLGYFDDGNDGFLTDHTVGIFDAGGNLLISTTLLAGTGDPLRNGFRYKAISPFTLAAGQVYTAAATSGGDRDYWAYGHVGSSIQGLVTDPSISIASNASRFLSQSDDILRDPLNTNGYTLYAGPNFEIGSDTAVTPEASSLALFSGPTLFGGFCLLRRRLRRT